VRVVGQEARPVQVLEYSGLEMQRQTSGVYSVVAKRKRR